MAAWHAGVHEQSKIVCQDARQGLHTTQFGPEIYSSDADCILITSTRHKSISYRTEGATGQSKQFHGASWSYAKAESTAPQVMYLHPMVKHAVQET